MSTDFETKNAGDSSPAPALHTAERSQRLAWVRYAGGQLAGSIGSLLFVLVVNFFVFRIMPGDPVRNLGRNRLVSARQMDQLRRDLGLGKPLPQQFVIYLKDTFTGQLGLSFKYRVPVSQLLVERLWPTLALVGTATILATIIGLYIGVVGAWHHGGRFDRISSGLGLTFYSMPDWWLGLLLLAAVGGGIGSFTGLLPTGGLISANVAMWTPHGVLNMIWHLFLPVTTLTVTYIAEYALIMRSSLLDEMGEPYLTTARAKGLRDVHVRRRAVRNAMLPSTTLIALNLGFVVAGAITVETVFSMPGLGLLTTDALSVPDYPLLQGVFLFFSTAVILANLVANLLYGWLDPRTRT